MSSSPFTSASSGESLTVVVADDVPEIGQIIQEWLVGLGHVVTCVSSGREALQIIRRQPCDIVITDILMPDGDGLEVITEMKRTKNPAGILAMSGGGDLLRAGDCLKIAGSLGAHAVLLKPFDRGQLLAAFDRVVRARRPATPA